MKRILTYAGWALAAILIAIQFVQPARTNPPADPAASFEAVAKPSPEASAVIGRACRDCHSNQTEWPWYSKIAPASWLVADDVKDGRTHLNFSEWNRLSPEMSKLRLGEACEEVKKGDMPLWQYTILHPNAKLTSADVAALCGSAQ